MAISLQYLINGIDRRNYPRHNLYVWNPSEQTGNNKYHGLPHQIIGVDRLFSIDQRIILPSNDIWYENCLKSQNRNCVT